MWIFVFGDAWLYGETEVLWKLELNTGINGNLVKMVVTGMDLIAQDNDLVERRVWRFRIQKG